MGESCYLCIDLKSFYASVECVERGLDPLKAKLVVADPERGANTICLAVTPALKKLGVSSRCRLFQIPQSIQYIKAVPRMKLYIRYSADIYKIYLKYFDKDDIHVYSIDEVFIDASHYRGLYGPNPRNIADMIMQDILKTTGITAACGIGTNLYLAKIALDIEAKKSKDGIAFLNEPAYREILWDHKPITDFWRIGRGTAARLEKYGITTMGQLAHADKNLMYKTFGVDAELLIDHAWGRESVTMADIKAYVPKDRSITSGQVFAKPYSYDKTELILKEMISSLCLELTEKDLLTGSVSLWIGYSASLVGDKISIETGAGAGASARSSASASGSISLPFHTDSYNVIVKNSIELYGKIADKGCLAKRVNISFNGLVASGSKQMDFFAELNNYGECSDKERNLSKSAADIKRRFGKNSLFRAMSLEDEATALERNEQIGGHKA